MIRRSGLAATGLLLILLSGGCDLFGGVDAPNTLAGAWRGTVTTADSNYTVRLTLQQPSDAGTQQVAGNGEVATDKTTWSFSVTGTFEKPSLSLELRFESARPGRLEGEVNKGLTKIEARLYGGPANFNGDTVTFERQ